MKNIFINMSGVRPYAASRLFPVYRLIPGNRRAIVSGQMMATHHRRHDIIKPHLSMRCPFGSLTSAV